MIGDEVSVHGPAWTWLSHESSCNREVDGIEDRTGGLVRTHPDGCDVVYWQGTGTVVLLLPAPKHWPKLDGNRQIRAIVFFGPQDERGLPIGLHGAMN